MGFLTGTAKKRGWSDAEQAATDANERAMAGANGVAQGPTGYDKKVYDAGTYGGGEAVVHYDRDSAGYETSTLVGDTSDTRELKRYRSLAEEAAKREAYKVDFGAAQADRANGLAARSQQVDALGMQRVAAEGGAPSRAAIMGNQAAGNSLEAAMAASAGARPMASRAGPGLAAASAAAQQNQASMQLGAQQQAMGGRSQEMNVARGAHLGGATGIRGGDYASMAMSQEQAEAQAKAEMAQRRLNQAGQMGYEQMGVNVEQATLDASMRRAATLNQQNATSQATRDANDARYGKIRGAIVSTMGSAVTASDERMKQDVKPAGFASAHAAKGDPMGAALAEMKPYEYEYKPQHAGAEGQAAGEKNVGPMAQDMAKNPITGSAVVRGDDGLLKVDMTKAGKLSLGAIGYLAAKQREQAEEIARLKKGGG